MDKKAPFSPGTIEGDHLISVSSEVRNAILGANGIHEQASDINDAVDQVLSTKEKSRTEIYKEVNVDEGEVDSILKINHPRAQALHDFVISSNENSEWYLNNLDNIKLVDDGIEILGDVFCLEDEKAPDGEGISNDNGYTYFNYDSAQKHAEDNGKRIPADWSKYINILPGNDENKVKFLTKVLLLHFAGGRVWNNGDTNARYWSSTPNSAYAYNLSFNTSYILPANINDRGYGFSVRCLKN